jgi:hypothetical protein
MNWCYCCKRKPERSILASTGQVDWHSAQLWGVVGNRARPPRVHFMFPSTLLLRHARLSHDEQCTRLRLGTRNLGIPT